MMNNASRFLLAMVMTALVGCAGADDETRVPDAVEVDDAEPASCGTDPSCTQAASNELPTNVAPSAILWGRKSGDDKRLD